MPHAFWWTKQIWHCPVMMKHKQSQASAVLISSKFAYQYRLQNASMNFRDIENIIVANEIPKEEMVELMVTKWKMSQELAEEFYLYFGGDVDLCKRAVKKLIQKGDSFDPIADVLDSGGLSMCANNPGARKHLQKMADQGWSPVKNVDEDAAAKLIAKKDVGGVLPRRAQIFGGPKDMFTDQHRYALVPAGTLMRWMVAEELELPLDTRNSVWTLCCEVFSEMSSLEHSMNRQIKPIRTPPQTIVNTQTVLGNFSCSYKVVFLFLGVRALTHCKARRLSQSQLRKDCTLQQTCHSSRVDFLIACEGSTVSPLQYHPSPSPV